MSITLVQISHFSDTCDDVQENTKIRSAYVKHTSRLKNIVPIIDLVPVKNTVDVGFNLSEAITNPEAAPRQILIGNYAPPDKPNGTDNNIRKEFHAASLVFAGRTTPIISTLNGFELSYVKPNIKELYVVRSDNGDQFRSLTLAPRTSVEFYDKRLREALITGGKIWQAIIPEAIPDVPDVSHVVHVDNFRNVKTWFSRADRDLLARTAADGGRVMISFLPSSIDPHCTIADNDPSLGSFSAAPRPTLFKAKIGEKIVAQRSSSFYIDGSNVPQIVELRRDPVRDATTYPIPHSGQRLHIQPVG